METPELEHSEQQRARIPTPPQKKSRWKQWLENLGIVGTAVSKVLSIIFYVVLISAFLGVGVFGNQQTTSGERLYGSGENTVAVVDVSGVIVDEDAQPSVLDQSGVVSVRQMRRAFEAVQNDSQVKAVILRINSPGGSVTASEEILQMLKQYKDKWNVPVIVSMSDLAASGGYYIAVGGDYLMANPATLTGSIGVLLQTYNVSELATKYGVKDVTIKSGANKDLLNPLQPVSDQQRELLQTVVDEAYEQFIDRILTNRSDLSRETLLSVADGRVLTGKQAQAVGLVDGLGTFDDAVQLAMKDAGIAEAQVIVFGKPTWFESLLGVATRRIPLIETPFDLIQSRLHGKLAYMMEL